MYIELMPDKLYELTYPEEEPGKAGKGKAIAAGDGDRELYDELYQVICEVVCVRHESVRIGGESYPYELVRAKFLKLNSSHLQYVMRSMRETTAKITNMKAYMITALYNAPSTMNHYYQQEVNHDIYGGEWEWQEEIV